VKIRDVGLRFDEPERCESPARLGAVFESICGSHTVGSNTALLQPDPGLTPAVFGLPAEALSLCSLVVMLQPDHADALGSSR